MTTKRTTQNLAEVEYANVHKDRVTQALGEVEYTNVHKNRITQTLVMVEYITLEFLVPPNGFQELTGGIRDMRG